MAENSFFSLLYETSKRHKTVDQWKFYRHCVEMNSKETSLIHYLAKNVNFAKNTRPPGLSIHCKVEELSSRFGSSHQSMRYVLYQQEYQVAQQCEIGNQSITNMQLEMGLEIRSSVEKIV